MNKKFSIATINIDKIFKEIDNYINQHYSNKNYDNCLPYLFMSEDTAKAIERECGIYNRPEYDTQMLSNKNKKSGIYAEFTGYKVYINNDLTYGVVEIR